MKKLFAFILALSFLGVVASSVFLLREQLPKGIERRTEMIGEREIVFDVINLSAGNFTWALANDPSMPQSVKAWRESLGGEIVFNGSYFDEKNEPTGYYVVNSISTNSISWPTTEEQEQSASYSFLVEVVDGELVISTLLDEPREKAPTTGFLSFPTLLANGSSLVKADTGLLAARTMLAKSATGDIYLITVEKGSLSLYEAASWLLRQSEGFTLAGNLDGGPSTGVSYTDGKRIFDELSASVPNVIVGSR